MADDDMEPRLRELERDHRLAHWRIGQVGRDLAEIGATQIDHTRRLDRIEAKLHEHTDRFDSLDVQLRTLTEMVQECLRRLPEPEQNGD